jgi:hypothetical protein
MIEKEIILKIAWRIFISILQSSGYIRIFESCL